MKSITAQELEAMLQTGQPEVTHCGKFLLVETKMGSMELPVSCLDTFTPKAPAKPKSVDPNADTRKMTKSAEETVELQEHPYSC